MPNPPIPKLSRRRPVKERRAPPGPPGSLRWLKGLLGRPVAIERRDGKLHVVLVERRRTHRPGASLELEPMLDELRVRLLADQDGRVATALPAITAVHDALDRNGWAGVGALPARTLRAAIAQAEALARIEPSRPLAAITDRLRTLHVGAELREQRAQAARPAEGADGPEVSESTIEEFVASERSWVAPSADPAGEARPDAGAAPAGGG